MVKGQLFDPLAPRTSSQKTILLLCWGLLSAFLLVLEQTLGTWMQFPVYILPVGLAVWYNGFRWGAVFAVLLPLFRLLMILFLGAPGTPTVSLINAAVRILGLLGFAFLIGYIVRQNKELEREIKILEGILPVCSFCKKIRDEQDSWHPIEEYISDRSEAMFSHSFCPSCYEEHYGEVRRPTSVKGTDADPGR